MRPESHLSEPNICDLSVSYRDLPAPSRQHVVLGSRLETSGYRRRANEARYRRGGGAKRFGGAHRRRNKRSALS